MRRIRNPRYAPEFLERRLSPSGLLGTQPPAEVQTFESDGGSLSATPNVDGPTSYSESDDQLPIDPVPPPDPAAPTDPAEAGDPEPIDPVPPPELAEPTETSDPGDSPPVDPVPPDDPAEPGDPEPVDPVPPPDPSGPA